MAEFATAEFLRRWSQRKQAAKASAEGGSTSRSGPGTQTEPRKSREHTALAPEASDLAALDFSSDFTRFMIAGISDEVRNAALRRLWNSSELIAKPDDLDDYLEDFREEAMAIAPELAASAYRIGSGFSPAPGDELEPDNHQSGTGENAAGDPDATAAVTEEQITGSPGSLDASGAVVSTSSSVPDGNASTPDLTNKNACDPKAT